MILKLPLKYLYVFASTCKPTDMRFSKFLYEFMSRFQYLENLVTSSDRDSYLKSEFAKKCERIVKGERVSGLSRSLI